MARIDFKIIPYLEEGGTKTRLFTRQEILEITGCSEEYFENIRNDPPNGEGGIYYYNGAEYFSLPWFLKNICDKLIDSPKIIEVLQMYEGMETDLFYIEECDNFLEWLRKESLSATGEIPQKYLQETKTSLNLSEHNGKLRDCLTRKNLLKAKKSR